VIPPHNPTTTTIPIITKKRRKKLAVKNVGSLEKILMLGEDFYHYV